MVKKSSQSPMKTSNKHDKKQQLNSLIKILRPKVYITESSNFKNLVQELTGNGNYSPAAASSPPPSTSVASLSPPTSCWEVPFTEADQYHHHHNVYQENSIHLPFDYSSCFRSTPSESLNYVSDNSLLASQKMDFYKDLEMMLMEMESDSYNYDACNGMFEQDACVYDYGLSTLI